MNENFIKLKKKSFQIRLIRASLVALSVGCLVFGALSLLTTFEKLSLWWVYSLCIALGATLVAWLFVFFVTQASDLKLAKRFDRQFGLREKTQTMLEFQNESEPIYELQRENTNEALKAVPIKQIRLRCWWIYAVCAFLSIGVLTASFVVQPKEVVSEEEPVEELPFEMTAMQRAALEKLIQEVGESAMQNPYRDNTVATLNALLDELLLAETENERDAALNSAMKKILQEVDNSSSAVEIMEALYIYGQENVCTLVKALNYYEWKTDSEWDSYYAGVTEFLASYDCEDETLTDEENSVALATLLLETGNTLSMGLTRANLSETDELYVALNKLNTWQDSESDDSIYGIKVLAERALAKSYEEITTELKISMNAFNPELFGAFEQSYVNTGTGERAVTRIAEIFGIKALAFKRPNLVSLDDGEGGNTSEDNQSGPSSTESENVYGSTEEVLDWTTGEYVQYGELFDSYQKDALGTMEKVSEEEREILKKYYDILAGVKVEDEPNE